MIHVNNLSYAYQRDGRFAVKDISFDIQKGEIFGFLGPSGAGKSTTQGILTGAFAAAKGRRRGGRLRPAQGKQKNASTISG